jgi:hypothetical protein
MSRHTRALNFGIDSTLFFVSVVNLTLFNFRLGLRIVRLGHSGCQKSSKVGRKEGASRLAKR